MRENVLFVIYGTVFGVVLSRSGAADYDFIQGMFLFTNLQLYGILAVAVTLTAIGLQVLRRVGRTATGEAIVIKPKTPSRGNVVGGVLFGIGWSITGMCPGPVLVNIGEGKLYALAAFAGVLTGAYLVGWFHEPLRRRLGLA
ncbi:transporter [bacterium]|nr:YeeE/YedE family protein [Chloroflexi bacterium CFX6]RIL11249.1 MAG: transporter [bacterium]